VGVALTELDRYSTAARPGAATVEEQPHLPRPNERNAMDTTIIKQRQQAAWAAGDAAAVGTRLLLTTEP
jgi:hypothetical protein